MSHMQQAGIEDMQDDALLVPMTTEQRMGHAIQKLPTLAQEQVPVDESCPVCLCPFSGILDGSMQNEGTLLGISPKPVSLSGITKLPCGHIFCRLDIIEWIRGRHGSCPTCRHVFLDISNVSESDTESTDDDYYPEEDEEIDEEDEWDEEEEEDWEDDYTVEPEHLFVDDSDEEHGFHCALSSYRDFGAEYEGFDGFDDVD